MICYKGRQYCTFYDTCDKRNDCDRPLTPEVQAEAVKWWGSDDAPISVFAEKPECHTDNQEKKEP